MGLGKKTSKYSIEKKEKPRTKPWETPNISIREWGHLKENEGKKEANGEEEKLIEKGSMWKSKEKIILRSHVVKMRKLDVNRGRWRDSLDLATRGLLLNLSNRNFSGVIGVESFWWQHQ